MTERGEGRGVLRRLDRDFLRPYRRVIAAALAGLLAQSVMLLPAPLLQGWVVDRLVDWAKAGPGAPSREDVGRAIVIGLAATVGLYLARAVLAWWTSSTMARISQEVVRSIRAALHEKLMRLPTAYFDAQQTGRLMARVTSDVGGVLSFVRSGVIQLLGDLILAAAITGLLFYLQWRLALAAMVAVPLYAANQRFFHTRLRTLSDQIRAQVSALYALLSERVSAVRVVRSFAREEAELAALDDRIDAHRALSWANTRTAAALGAIATLISGLGTVFVVGYGVVLVGRGVVSVGELLAFYALIGQLYAPIVRLSQFQAVALSTQVSLERLYEIFDEPEPIRDRPDARAIVVPRGRLEFRDVRFAFPRRRRAENEHENDDEPENDEPAEDDSIPAPNVLDGLSLTVEPGRRVGVLGASGAGKSTLLALAPRLYDVADDAGAVLFDGVDVRKLKLADLRRAVALVPQQAILFEGTILSNLLYANPDARPEEVRRALEVADLKALVDGLPGGLDTPVGERGYSLSGGQRQRLALARAIVANPAVLLMDDCTSALDAETEARIQDALERRLPGLSSVIVSHKISSVRRCDLIVVLDRGRIVERGSHDQLLAIGRRYAETFRQQTRSLAHIGVE